MMIKIDKKYISAVRSVAHSPKAMMMLQEMASDPGEIFPNQGCEDLALILGNSDGPAKSELLCWLFVDSGRESLKLLLSNATGDVEFYDTHPDFARRVNYIDQAYEAVRVKIGMLNAMPVIKKIAFGNGADFSELMDDHDLSKSIAFCNPLVPKMTPNERKTYLEALDVEHEKGVDEVEMEI